MTPIDTKLQEVGRPIEERIIERIVAGSDVNSQEIEELGQEIDPADFGAMLAKRYNHDPSVVIHADTVFQLIKFDPIFLGNPFVQDRIRAWQQEARVPIDESRDNLRKIGLCLDPSPGRGNKSLFNQDVIEVFEYWRKTIWSFRKTTKAIKPDQMNLETTAKLLIELGRIAKEADDHTIAAARAERTGGVLKVIQDHDAAADSSIESLMMSVAREGVLKKIRELAIQRAKQADKSRLGKRVKRAEMTDRSAVLLVVKPEFSRCNFEWALRGEPTRLAEEHIGHLCFKSASTVHDRIKQLRRERREKEA